MRAKFFLRGVSAALTIFLAAVSASAATVTVTTTADSGAGSFRDAIAQVNAGSADTIHFAIGSGPQVIQPASVYPAITQPVTIDARTQPGYSGTPLIEINGLNVAQGPSDVGLSATGTGTEIYGLALNYFVNGAHQALQIGSATVRACYIGVTRDGKYSGYNYLGIEVLGSATIGGTAPEDANWFGSGVSIYISAGSGRFISVQGNQFGGVEPGGQLWNAAYGLTAMNSTGGRIDIGGEAPNYFVTSRAAMAITQSEHVNFVGNIVGAMRNGVVPNQGSLGVEISANGALVQDNVFVRRRVNAVVVMRGIGNKILGNSMSGDGFGIDLNDTTSAYDYATPDTNDEGDGDGGPNNGMNYPAITSVASGASSTTVSGRLSTRPNRAVHIELFSSAHCNASGYGEGETLIDSFDVSSGPTGVVFFTRPLARLSDGAVVTATATTDVDGTSEFSPCVAQSEETHGSFALDSAAMTLPESGTAQLLVSRRDGASGAATVDYTITPGTASAGSDYTAANGTLSFADGETSKTIVIPITADALHEDDETFTVALSHPTGGATLGTTTSTQITIDDDDPRPSVSATAPDVTEGTGANTGATVTVRLAAPAGKALSVPYATQPGTAAASSDYVSTSGTLSFAAGETEKSFSVSIVADAAHEADESFTVVTGYAGEVSTAVHILDDDALPRLSIAGTTVRETNGVIDVPIAVTSDIPFTGSARVIVENGSAVQPSDFFVDVTDVVFHGGTTVTLTVHIAGDGDPEPQESFTIRLAPSDAYEISAGAATVFIDNDDIGVGPALRSVAVGDQALFTIQLGTPVTTDTNIALASSDPTAVSVLDHVVVAAGTSEAQFAAKALLAPRSAAISVTMPPSLGGQAYTVNVDTYVVGRLLFTPATLQMYAGQTLTVHASLDPPSAAPLTVALSSSDATVPAAFTIPPSGSGSFDVTAVRSGSITIRATLPADYGSVVVYLTGRAQAEPSAPAITGITPSSGPVAGGTAVEIAGVKLTSDCTIAFGNIPAAQTQFVSATLLRATTPAHARGAVDVVLTCGAQTSSLRNAFTFNAQSARITSVVPSSGSTGGNTHVRIRGESFADGCWAYFGGLPARAVTFEDATSMTAVTPAHATGRVSVTVRCASGSGVANDAFDYVGSLDPAAIVNGVTPLAAAPGERVTLSGANFRTNDTVRFNGQSARVVTSLPDTQVVVVPLLPAGSAQIVVGNGAVETAAVPGFTVLEALRPRIDAVAPSSAPAGAELALTGGGFRPDLAFELGGRIARTNALDATHAVVTIPGDVAPGAYDLHVLASGAVIATGPRVTVLANGLVVRNISPRCAASSGGAFATLTGAGFTADTRVSFAGAAATDVALVDATTLRARVPAGATGLAVVTVTTGSATATMTNIFRYVSPFDPQGCSEGRSRAVRH
ncbi:MAG TPA: IPT/TIG domain-containing protein [Thermoanaerobaculia bacterium]|jgi:hypothetical protein